MHTDFASAAERLASAGERYDVIVVDLGVSSPQLDHDARGFSFMQAGPLDMRMDRRQARTAEQVVNTYSRAELVRIITQYGEEQPRFAARIAAAIQAHRPITSTTAGGKKPILLPAPFRLYVSRLTKSSGKLNNCCRACRTYCGRVGE